MSMLDMGRMNKENGEEKVRSSESQSPMETVDHRSSPERLPGISLKRPTSPPRISVDDPAFACLTNAEKLNDRKFRALVYKAYPDESTCCCLPSSDCRVTPSTCRSGCLRSCCMLLRNPNALLTRMKMRNEDAYDDVDTFCCNVGLGSELSAKLTSDVMRIRGGRGEEICDPSTGCCDEYKNTEYKYRDAPGAQKARSATDPESCGKPCFKGSASTGGCTCAGKERAMIRGGRADCTKKPCVGIDCLLRAFKDAQDFVDSLGKVPGLVGLGLMDPSESPYFSRDPNTDCALPDLPKVNLRERPRGSPMQSLVASREGTAPCNMEIAGTAGCVAPFPPSTIAVPGRTGVVREGIPSAPDHSSVTVPSKTRKKEEKKEDKADKQKELEIAPVVPLEIDVGPCGEPKCKSRKKKPVSDANAAGGSIEAAESAVKVAGAKQINPIAARIGSKTPERGKHHKSKEKNVVAGPGGNRPVQNMPHQENPVGHHPNASHAKSGIRVSKQVMRYVYSIGDVYPGVNFGHKTCIDPRFRVPANMGWLWNTNVTYGKLKPRVGWRPGAISHYLNELLKVAKAGSLSAEDEKRPRSIPSRTKRGKVYKGMSYSSAKKAQAKKERVEELESPPTLHIHRKDGTYYVTMYPIKAETANIPQLEEPMKPLQFKILKNKDDASDATSSTASDMEIEFSPPAAVNRYHKQPDVIHVETQVRYQEILDAVNPPDSGTKKEKKIKKDKKGKK